MGTPFFHRADPGTWTVPISAPCVPERLTPITWMRPGFSVPPHTFYHKAPAKHKATGISRAPFSLCLECAGQTSEHWACWASPSPSHPEPRPSSPLNRHRTCQGKALTIAGLGRDQASPSPADRDKMDASRCKLWYTRGGDQDRSKGPGRRDRLPSSCLEVTSAWGSKSGFHGGEPQRHLPAARLRAGSRRHVVGCVRSCPRR